MIALFLLSRLTAPRYYNFKLEKNKMTDFRVAAYEAYLSAWAGIAGDERLRLLRESVTEGVVFKNPMQTRTGIADLTEHLEEFQGRSPGGSFRFLAMLGWEVNAMATWQFVDAEGNGGFTGYDILTFDKNHKIESIVLFGNVEKQTLK